VNLFAGSRPELDRLRRELEETQDLLAAASTRVRLLEAVVEAVPVGLIVAGADGRSIMRSAAARLGGHSDVLLDEAVEEILRATTKGSSAQRRLELFGPPQRVLSLRSVTLSGGGALVMIDDISERVRLDAVRTDFVANISHELKTPVGALTVLAETLADSDDHEEIGRAHV
jgi:two-component system sensor histidine kinase SenX3